MRGILDHCRSHTAWELEFSPEGMMVPLESLESWTGNGIIAMLDSPHRVRLATTLNIPLVNIASTIETPDVMTVIGDNRYAGRLAAEHLIDRGFRRFAYYGLQGIWYSQQRLEGFREALARSNFTCSVLETPKAQLEKKAWSHSRAELEEWLQRLTHPVGIFAVHDYRARMVMELSVRLGFSIPHQVALVGVDDDPVVCEYGNPTLTSIRQDGQRVGAQAAATLDDLMANPGTASRLQQFAPVGLMRRESTRTTAVDDPCLQEAIRLIDQRMDQGIDVAAIINTLGVSRRWLERLFRQHLNCTPHAFLCRARVDHAKQLMAIAPRRKLHRIAAECGLQDARRLNVVFERVTGQSVREYLRASRASEA